MSVIFGTSKSATSHEVEQIVAPGTAVGLPPGSNSRIVQPALADGAIATGPASLVLPFTISSPNGIEVGNGPSGLPGILYAGAAPGMVAGVTQINLHIPISSFHGLTLITLESGALSSSQADLFPARAVSIFT